VFRLFDFVFVVLNIRRYIFCRSVFHRSAGHSIYVRNAAFNLRIEVRALARVQGFVFLVFLEDLTYMFSIDPQAIPFMYATQPLTCGLKYGL